MSLNPDIRDQAYQFFIEEAQELLQVLETGLLDLRQDHSTPKVHELMRAAHSIKGGAASVELGAIELLAHRLEDFFKALYSDEVEFDAELEGLLLQGYDCLSNPLTEQIEVGTFDEEAALLTAEPVFAALEVRLEDALKNADNYIPSSNDLGVDIVESIFEVDVVQALEHLQAVVAAPANCNPAEELQGTLEMFAGFAELFSLPGFSEIVQTAQVALTQNPDQVIEIINATIADCAIAKDQVLAGDRTQGGVVSSALAALAQAPASTAIQNESNENEVESNFAFEEIGLDQDHLWADVPAMAPLAEDIFSTLDEENVETESPEVTAVDDTEPTIAFDEIALDQDSLWADAPLDEPLAEDIFATLPEENVESDDDLSQIFGKVPEPQADEANQSNQSIKSDEIVLDQDSLWSNMPATEPLAGDIFDTIPEENLELAAEPETQAAIDADLNQLFPQVDAESVVIESSSEPTETVEDIEQVFNLIPAAEDDISQVWETVSDLEDSSTLIDHQTDSKKLISTKSPQPENLGAAIASIEDIFDSLPHESTSFASPQETTSQPEIAQPASPSNNAKAAPKLSVRVDLDRLERMNNLVGELTINRNGLALQNDQLQENVSELGQKFLRFRGVTRKLREISDQLLLEQRVSGSSGLTSSPQPSFLSQEMLPGISEFDSLEMDSYSLLYSSLQEVLEEVLQLEESVDDITIFAQQSDRTINTQRQMLDQMRDELMWVRMLPLDQILQRFPRTLRELSNKYQKPVELKLNGTGVLVDKAVLEKLADPLLHLLRNGFDHGIESPEIRTQQGKSATGSIEIRAYYQGNQTVIEVKDDGKGLDIAKITKKGIEKGLISTPEATCATKERIFDLIFEPGFSTASKVSELSGRGVGMNIVRSQIETLKGRISVTSIPGEGSTFTMRLPLTLTIAKLLVCSLGSTAFAIPSDSIEEIVIPTPEQVKFANEQRFLFLGYQLIPIYSLQKVLSYNCPILDASSNNTAFKTIAPPEDWLAPLLILRRGQQLFALEIASLLSEQELVIKPYGKAIAAPVYSYGCTILSDGSLIPAFDGSALISTILGEEVQPISSSFTPVILSEVASNLAEETIAKETTSNNGIISSITNSHNTSHTSTSVKTIMVVDDSTALRRTMALTLEKEGYRVVQKKDGKEAIAGFKQNPELDLIICDVEMPVMNGFEFLGMRRRDSVLSKVTTFMLTSRSGAKHRNLAVQLGADGYFTKPYVEQEFVEEVNKILINNSKNVNSPGHKAIAIKAKTILIIDDSSALRRTLALSLEQRGYQILQGRDGFEGLQQLRDNLQTDLVICDVEMPNVNGFEFLTARRKEPPLTDVPVIMLTSRGSEKHRSLAKSLGAAGFFTKPYVEEQFMQEIEKYVR